MKRKNLNLTDMDIGLFVSYELTGEAFITKLFRKFTLNSVPVDKVMDIRRADEKDITKLNRLNWFTFLPWCRSMSPIYTIQADKKTPRIFMKLTYGTHLAMEKALNACHGNV